MVAMEDLNLRQLRLVNEISIAQMAKQLDVHPNTYSGWEEEPERIPIGKAKKIAVILGTTMDELFSAIKADKM